MTHDWGKSVLGNNWGLEELDREMLWTSRLMVKARLAPLGPTKKGLVFDLLRVSRIS